MAKKRKMRHSKLTPRICNCCMQKPSIRKSRLNDVMVICETKGCQQPIRTTWRESENLAIADWNRGHTKPARDSLGRRS
jgi:hypothetical protein